MIRTHGRRPLTCHHEAGHAVARWWLGFRTDDVAVLTVDAVLAGETLADRRGRAQRCEGLVNGYDIHIPTAREQMAGLWDSVAHRANFVSQASRRAEMAIVELYAGPYAETRYTKRSALDRFLAGGMGDVNAVREIAAGWFATEDEQKVTRAYLGRSPLGWAPLLAFPPPLLGGGRLDGDEVDTLCSATYGAPFAYDRWAECWPPSPAQIHAGFLPAREARQAA